MTPNAFSDFITKAGTSLSTVISGASNQTSLNSERSSCQKIQTLAVPTATGLDQQCPVSTPSNRCIVGSDHLQ
jgi:hypothetical protein